MKTVLRHSTQLALCIVLLSVAPSATSAKELRALADIVLPAYTAMNFTVVCAREDPYFLRDTSGPRGTSLHYAEHVKDEVIASLTNDEAIAVLKAAADDARLVARNKIRELAVLSDDAATIKAIRMWCDGPAKQFVLKFIELHDGRHAEIAELIRRAQQ